MLERALCACGAPVVPVWLIAAGSKASAEDLRGPPTIEERLTTDAVRRRPGGAALSRLRCGRLAMALSRRPIRDLRPCMHCLGLSYAWCLPLQADGGEVHNPPRRQRPQRRNAVSPLA